MFLFSSDHVSIRLASSRKIAIKNVIVILHIYLVHFIHFEVVLRICYIAHK